MDRQLCVPFRLCELRDPAQPHLRRPLDYIAATNWAMLLLPHLILTTPLKVGGGIPTLQMKKLRCKEIKLLVKMKTWVSGGVEFKGL